MLVVKEFAVIFSEFLFVECRQKDSELEVGPTPSSLPIMLLDTFLSASSACNA